jgi:hypothetical protein
MGRGAISKTGVELFKDVAANILLRIAVGMEKLAGTCGI